MPDMRDYLAMRGDLTFEKDPFNDIDNLLLIQLPFLDFTGIVPEEAGKEIDLQTAVSAYFDGNRGKDLSLGVIIPKEIFGVAKELSIAPRFEKCALSAYRYVLREEKGEKEQWSAITVRLPDNTLFVAFAGTDDTLASWKEDLDMAFAERIPSQEAAAEYLNGVFQAYPGYPVRVGGHSKGGNLAVYASSKCQREYQSALLAVYDNDGPGFAASFLESEGYKAVRGKIKNILPEHSFVGLLFGRDLAPTVVKSSYKGLMQHDSFSWQVKRNALDTLPSLAEDALETRETLCKWLEGMEEGEKKEFIEALENILSGTDAETLTELSKNKTGLLRSYRALSKEERAALHGALKKLYKAGKEVRTAVSAEKSAKEKAAREKGNRTTSTKPTKSTKSTKKKTVTFLDGAALYKTGKEKKTRNKTN